MRDKIKRMMPESETLFLVGALVGVLYILIDCGVKMSSW